MILLLGSKGNMGRRYSAILKYLCIPFRGVDVGDPIPNKNYTGVLIATPTDTHLELIETYTALGLPILCEKPIAKNMVDVEKAVACARDLTMVNQYAYLVPKDADGATFYNYWNSGKDGPQWDCINIIGMDKGKNLPVISNESPVWTCVINGQVLSIKDMDVAYCRMVKDWWVKRIPTGNAAYIVEAHRRIIEKEYIHE